MSLAWTTVVLLVLLLPGFLFFIGLYAPERISRDVVSGSALGQLAGVVLVSFLAHAATLLVNLPFCQQLPIPCVNLEYVFVALQLVDVEQHSLAELHTVLTDNLVWITLYVGLTGGAGYGVGWGIGRLILRGWLRSFARHGWIYDLIAANRQGGVIHAYVLTNIRHEGRVLMYRGFLKEFYTAPDGRITYLVLKDCLRYYLKLEDVAPLTSEEADWQVLGASYGYDTAGVGKHWSYLMIEGDDIANVVFEGYRPKLTEEGLEALDQALAALRAGFTAESERPKHKRGNHRRVK